jgi:fumarate reductase subunit D
MTNGLILLAFLAALVAFGWARFRRRLGMAVTGRTLVSVMVGFVLVVLALWAAAHR